MKTKIFLVLLVLSLVPTFADKSISIVMQAGSSIGITGYNKDEEGYKGKTNLVETEFLPGFILSNLEFGLGTYISDKTYIAFMVGGWVDSDIIRYAVTTASLYYKYAFTDNNISPIFTFQGGLFLEEFPQAMLGAVINPSIGFEFDRSSRTKFHISVGYLLTHRALEEPDVEDPDYIRSEEEQRHAVSLNIGITF